MAAAIALHISSWLAPILPMACCIVLAISSGVAPVACSAFTIALAMLSWLSPLAARDDMSVSHTLSTEPRRCFIAFFIKFIASFGISPFSMASLKAATMSISSAVRLLPRHSLRASLSCLTLSSLTPSMVMAMDMAWATSCTGIPDSSIIFCSRIPLAASCGSRPEAFSAFWNMTAWEMDSGLSAPESNIFCSVCSKLSMESAEDSSRICCRSFKPRIFPPSRALLMDRTLLISSMEMSLFFRLVSMAVTRSFWLPAFLMILFRAAAMTSAGTPLAFSADWMRRVLATSSGEAPEEASTFSTSSACKHTIAMEVERPFVKISSFRSVTDIPCHL